MRGLMVYSAASKSENVQGELVLNLVYCAKLYYQKVTLILMTTMILLLSLLLLENLFVTATTPFYKITGT